MRQLVAHVRSLSNPAAHDAVLLLPDDPNAGQGEERLIDLVHEKILPAHYDLRSEQAIAFGDKVDHMDVYVRRDP